MIAKHAWAAALIAVSIFGTGQWCAAESPLADAAESADWAKVHELLIRGADLNAPQVDGMTALHWACWHDDAESALLLVQRGAAVSAKNHYGVTALSLACLNGNGTIAERLLKAGADANASIAGGETALMTASRTGAIDVVESLLQHGADVDAKDPNEQTAVMWAAAEGHAAVVQRLIEAGADWNVPLKSGFNAMFFAVREGQPDVIDVLLAAGADVNAIMQPQIRGPRVARGGTSPLLLAVENGHFELAVRLLEAGADPNDQRSGFTALHAISWVRKPNLGDGVDGDPPPIGSGKLTSLEFVRKLVEHGADVNARLQRGSSGRGQLTHRGATPFLFAADTADVPLMTTLLDLGADPSLANADNCPPLLAAAGVGTRAPGEEAGTEAEAMEAVRMLLDLGADLNAVDNNGETAMHGAAYASWPQMVDLLADRGAEIGVWNAKNKYGWTPLTIARGHRPGNFKPAPATIAAIETVMRSAGVQPSPPSQ